MLDPSFPKKPLNAFQMFVRNKAGESNTSIFNRVRIVRLYLWF
ncbi:unnamed protein product [Enterobius vermicularis]|uniref:Integrase n=1 Tax=Enterobius vermicularis TaxID=51028 RepID=A0A0N4V3L5_ENTVE|nr:unnamed protein product [Enterobius vermicularis]